MTYPPPPGAPGDPRYPSPDPYAQPGGYAGPTPDPYGAPRQPGFAAQPSPQDPYSAPPADPYASPPPDPYGQQPYSAPPGSPSDPYGQQPYSAPPGQPPIGDPYGAGFIPTGQPPRKNGNAGWIIGGAVGVVVILVAMGGVVLLLNQSGDDSAGGSEDPSTSDEPRNEHSGSPGEDASGDGGSDARYTVMDGMCEELDYSATSDVFDVEDPEGGLLDDDQVYCSGRTDNDDYSGGFVATRMVIFEDTAAAESGLDSEKDASFILNPKEVTGPWDQGEADLSDRGGGFVVQAGNAVIGVDIYPPDDEKIDPASAEEVAGTLTENMMTIGAR